MDTCSQKIQAAVTATQLSKLSPARLLQVTAHRRVCIWIDAIWTPRMRCLHPRLADDGRIILQLQLERLDKYLLALLLQTHAEGISWKLTHIFSEKSTASHEGLPQTCLSDFSVGIFCSRCGQVPAGGQLVCPRGLLVRKYVTRR